MSEKITVKLEVTFNTDTTREEAVANAKAILDANSDTFNEIAEAEGVNFNFVFDNDEWVKKLETEVLILKEQISEMSPDALNRLESDNLQLCENITKLQNTIMNWIEGINTPEITKLANHLIEQRDKK